MPSNTSRILLSIFERCEFRHIITIKICYPHLCTQQHTSGRFFKQGVDYSCPRNGRVGQGQILIQPPPPIRQKKIAEQAEDSSPDPSMRESTGFLYSIKEAKFGRVQRRDVAQHTRTLSLERVRLTEDCPTSLLCTNMSKQRMVSRKAHDSRILGFQFVHIVSCRRSKLTM